MFWGTPAVAADCLKFLLKENKNVVAVVSQPDKPVGRKQILTCPPVKVVAKESGIPVLQPETLKNQEIVEKIKSYNPDICVVVAYGKILPSEILKIPENFINLHFSLLPEYRGAALSKKLLLMVKKKLELLFSILFRNLIKAILFYKKN